MGLPFIVAGLLLGWGLGANDSANVFGIAVYTKTIKYGTAIGLTALFVLLGALIDGQKGINNLSNYGELNGITTVETAGVAMLAAAITVIILTVLKLPISTSQAVIGAIMGVGLTQGKLDLSKGVQFFSAWVLTPVGAMIIAFLLIILFEKIFEKRMSNFAYYERFVKIGFLLSGLFAAYSLGANNVANVTALFANKTNGITPFYATLLGGISIGVGVLTFSKPVMATVGEKLVPLSSVSGFLTVLASALTVYFYAQLGIPVSTSQAVVGAVIGIGLRKGIRTINWHMLRNILLGWIGTPLMACVFCVMIVWIAGIFQ